MVVRQGDPILLPNQLLYHNIIKTCNLKGFHQVFTVKNIQYIIQIRLKMLKSESDYLMAKSDSVISMLLRYII